MKSASNSNRFYSKSRLLLWFLVVLLTGCVLAAGFGAITRSFAARIASPHATKSDLISNSDSAGRLDEQGNRPQAISFRPAHRRHPQTIRPTGKGDWFSLGPPGGDVFDAAVSTADP